MAMCGLDACNTALPEQKMLKCKFVKPILLVSFFCVSCAAYAAPRQIPQVNKVAALVDDAFGAIWMDSDMEDAGIEAAVRAALGAGASPNARDKYGDTLLIQAIENNRPSVVRLLIKRGANVNLPDTRLGDTPLIRASYSNDLGATGAKPLTTLVRLLLQSRADPNRRNKAGETALTLAAALGHADVVAELLKAGANFRLGNEQGATPLKLASMPVPRGSIYFASPMPNLTNPNDPKQVEKDIREHEKMLERMARAEEQRLSKGRAEVRRLLQAAGAKE
jgi:ankyrin repeat protein